MLHISPNEKKHVISVLMVDDDDDQLELSKVFLEEIDPSLKIITASTPRESLGLIREQRFDCIVSDYAMPEMDGIQLCAEIKKNNIIPFILYTGRGSEEVAEKAFEAGADDYIRKEKDPNHFQVLARRIRHTVEKHRAEERLERERDILQSVMNGAKKIHLVYLDRDFNFVRVNEAYAETCGYKPEEMIGKNHFTLYPHEENEVIFARVKDTGVAEHYHDKPFVFPDQPDRGVTYWDWTLEPIKDSSGRVEGLVFSLIETTERRKSEEKLARQSELMEAVLESSDGPVFSVDNNYLYTSFNSRHAETMKALFGADIKIGQNILDYHTNPQDRKAAQANIDRALQGETVIMESFAGDEARTRRCFEIVHNPIRDSLGEVKGVAIFAKDITERKMFQEQLVNEKKRFQSLLDSGLDGITVNTAGKLVYVNDSFAKMMGYDLEELLDKNILDLHAPEYREKVRSITERRQSGEPAPIRYEVELLRRDGTRLPVEYSVSLIEYEGKKSSLTIIRDVAEKKRLEELNRAHEGEIASMNEELAAQNEELLSANAELNKANSDLAAARDLLQEYANDMESLVERQAKKVYESEERLRSFMNSAADGFALYDSELRLLDANPTVIKRFPKGTKKEDLLGKKITELYPEMESTVWYEAYLKVLKTGEPYFNEGISGVSVLNNRIMQASAFKVGNGLGVISRDVTDRELLEEKLRQIEKIDAVSRMSAMLAHDLRGPLSTINQAAEMIKKSPERSHRMLKMIKDNTTRALNMIEEIRAGTKEITPRMEETDLAEMIRATSEETQIPDNVRMELEIGDGIESVYLDPDIIRRVLDNLVINAIEAMPNGGTVSLKGRREGSQVCIEVSDTGVGIPEEVQPRIFEPFFSIKPKGLGLGLPYCGRAVEAHGGTINFTTKKEEGTTFTLKIPYKPDQN